MPEEDQDFGEMSITRDEMSCGGGGDDGQPSGSVREAASNLGDQQDMGGGFSSAAGALVDALVPNVGDKGKLTLGLNFPLPQVPGFSLGGQLEVETERDNNGVKLKVSVQLQATQRVNAVFFEAWVQARVGGYMEAYGDSGAECFRLFALGIYHRISQVHEGLAGAIVNGRDVAQTVRGMDRDDYVESAVYAGVSGGVGDGSGDNEASAGVTAAAGSRLARDYDSDPSDDASIAGLEDRGLRTVEVAVRVAVSPFSVEGKVKLKWIEGRFDGIEIEVSGRANLNVENLEQFVTAAYIGDVASSVSGLLTGNSAITSEGAGAARMAGSLGSFITRSCAGGAGMDVATSRAMSRLATDTRATGANSGFKLTVKGATSRSAGESVEITLERVSDWNIGDARDPGVYVALENVQRIFQIRM